MGMMTFSERDVDRCGGLLASWRGRCRGCSCGGGSFGGYWSSGIVIKPAKEVDS